LFGLWKVFTEDLEVLKKEVVVRDIDKKYDHPLAEIVQVASQFKSEILLEYDRYRINAKSIMGIIAFNPSEGMNVVISAEGKDESDAVDTLEKFLVCR
jgi:phosphocarrier protein